jgi:hypothetical protein
MDIVTPKVYHLWEWPDSDGRSKPGEQMGVLTLQLHQREQKFMLKDNKKSDLRSFTLYLTVKAS